MRQSLVPLSLRKSLAGAGARFDERDAAVSLTAVAVMVASSGTAAEAQQTPAPLPSVTVDAPTPRARAAAPKPSQQQIKARAALRRKVRERAQAAAATRTPSAGPQTVPVFARAPDANPYADPVAPYKADRLSSSKFTQPILNTPKTVTVLTKEVLEDKNATSLREIARTTAGVTLGSGEGGNAFGDRFFIRGFDARNDVFVDGVRDPGVSIRENFFTEQVEILRGPASSFAGRGTTGGAINIVTKQAGDRNFANVETTLGSDQTKRLTLDVNRAISPVLDVRLNGMVQGANVAGRQFTSDNRNGVAGAVTFRPTSELTIKADYAHTYLSGLPDFGVPYNLQAQRPVTEGFVPSSTYYGILNRDFTKTMQNIGTLDVEYKVNERLTLENKLRQSYSILNYVGTIPENPSTTNGAPDYTVSTSTYFSGYTQLNAQSRFQTSAALADQPQAKIKFDTGPLQHVAILGGEFSRERVSINSYQGLTSEASASQGLVSSSGAPIVSVFNPTNYIAGLGPLTLGTTPQIYHVDTNAAYLLDTASWNDVIIGNAGIRFDDYRISATNGTSAQANHSGMPSFNLGLVLKPIPITSIYAAYATASQPVGAELDAVSSSYGGLSPTQPTTQIFSPQRSRSIEVGNKWEVFNRHLLVTGAAFQTNVNNARETAPSTTPADAPYVPGQVVAGAAYRVQGLDFEVAGKITERWSVLGGLVLMKSAVTNSIVPTNIGLPLANIAHRSFNLLSKYQINDWVEVGGQATYDSQIYGGSLLAANGGVAYGLPPAPTILPSHWRFDAFAEAKIGPYATMKLYAQNIFNKTYYDSLYQSGVPFVRVAPGRTISLITSVKF